jgi:hypothetical protein
MREVSFLPALRRPILGRDHPAGRDVFEGVGVFVQDRVGLLHPAASYRLRLPASPGILGSGLPRSRTTSGGNGDGYPAAVGLPLSGSSPWMCSFRRVRFSGASFDAFSGTGTCKHRILNSLQSVTIGCPILALSLRRYLV